ncbi:hypothetical protein ACU4GR_16555 [Methylobacterium oryzae CBMB20]
MVAISLASTTVHLSWEVRIALNQILLVAFVTLTGWCCATALHIATVIYLRRFKLDAEDNLLARKHFTQMRILERAGVTLVALDDPVGGADDLRAGAPVRCQPAGLGGRGGPRSSGWPCSRSCRTSWPASRSPSPSRSGSRTRSSSRTSGAGSRRSPPPTWWSASGTGAGWSCR